MNLKRRKIITLIISFFPVIISFFPVIISFFPVIISIFPVIVMSVCIPRCSWLFPVRWCMGNVTVKDRWRIELSLWFTVTCWTIPSWRMWAMFSPNLFFVVSYGNSCVVHSFISSAWRYANVNGGVFRWIFIWFGLNRKFKWWLHLHPMPSLSRNFPDKPHFRRCLFNFPSSLCSRD